MKCVLCTISLARLLACVGTVSGTLIAVALIADEWYTKADWWVAIFTFGLFVATLGLWIFTALLWQATKQALVDGQKSVETANAAVVVANRHADASASGAQAMGDVALAMNEQRSIMASQRDLSSATQRAWVSVAVQVDGPMKFEHESAFGSLLLQLRNNGSLPAFVERVWTAAHPWDQYPNTSLDPNIAEHINKHIATPLKPRGVIFPQQAVSEPSGYGIMKSQIDIARNQAMGLDIVIRGVVRYTYPGDSAIHYTTFHVHIFRAAGSAARGEWGPLPTENGALVPAVELLVTNLMGQTEAT